MRIKGTAVRTLPKYILLNYPEKYQQWLDSLPPQSQSIFLDKIYPSHFYDLHLAAVEPIKVFAKIIEQTPEDLAFDVGKFSAEDAFRGVYKIFASITSANFYIRKAKTIFATYYDDVIVDVNASSSSDIELHIGRVDEQDKIIYNRIAGWIYMLVIVTQRVEPTVDYEYIKNDDGTISFKLHVQW